MWLTLIRPFCKLSRHCPRLDSLEKWRNESNKNGDIRDDCTRNRCHKSKLAKMTHQWLWYEVILLHNQKGIFTKLELFLQMKPHPSLVSLFASLFPSRTTVCNPIVISWNHHYLIISMPSESCDLLESFKFRDDFSTTRAKNGKS